MPDDYEGESDTPAGTETAAPLTLDSPEALNFYDPDEDGQETTDAEGTQKGNRENPDQSETEIDDQSADEEAEGPEVLADDKMVLELPDGKKITVAEARTGILRQSDYSQKTEAIARHAEQLGKFTVETKSTAARVMSMAQRFEKMLDGLVPAKPDYTLATSDPNEFVKQAQMHEQLTQLVANLRSYQEEAKTEVGQLDKAALDRHLAEQRNNLAIALPFTSNPQKYERFMADMEKTAEKLKFTKAEFQRTTDHRLFVLLNLAKEGLEARDRSKSAKAKLQQVPEVKSPKRLSPANRNAQAQALRTAKSSGRIDDIMRVDFD